jgi:hypothetical protein
MLFSLPVYRVVLQKTLLLGQFTGNTMNTILLVRFAEPW